MKIDFQKDKDKMGEKQNNALTIYGYFWTMFSLGKGKVGDLWYFVSIATLFGVFKISTDFLLITAIGFVIGTTMLGIILTKKHVAQKEQDVATRINPVYMEILDRLERIEKQLDKKINR